MGRKFDVCIGILTRNSEKTIKKCLASIIANSFPKDKMQIIIVDNLSNDNTLKYAKKILELSGINFKIFINEVIGALGRSRQMVVDNCDADYVIWIDSDAVIPPTYIHNQLQYIKQSKAAIVFPYAILALNTDNILARMQGYAWSISTLIALKRGKTPFLGTLGTIMDINIIKKVGGFNITRIGAGEDLELILKVKRNGYKLSINSNPHATIYHLMKENWRDIINRLRAYRSDKETFNIHPKKIFSFLQGFIKYTLFAYIALYVFRDPACLLIPIYGILCLLLSNGIA